MEKIEKPQIIRFASIKAEKPKLPEYSKEFMDEVIQKLRILPPRKAYESLNQKVPLSLLFMWKAEDREKQRLEK